MAKIGDLLPVAMRNDLRTPMRFGLVGFANTLVGVCTIWILEFMEAGHLVANAGGYAIGLTLSFVLNRNWTFAHSGSIVRSGAQFLLVFAVAYVANLAVVFLLAREFGVNVYLAQVSGMPIYTVLFYLGSRYLAFATRPSSACVGGVAPEYPMGK